MKLLLSAGILASASLLSTTALAQHDHHYHGHHHDKPSEAGLTLSGDAHGLHKGHHNHDAHPLTPIGVMGDHVHQKGDWMVSYRYMRMEMEGNRDGTSDLSPTEISGDFVNVTSVGPSTLRIVPTSMTMEMHMLGAMYAPTDWLTLMGMGHFMEKDMQHITFAAADADLEIGGFTTNSRGFGDTKFAGLFDLYSDETHSFVLKAGLSVPTAKLNERGNILNPAGVTQNVRLPYAMQLGSGTYDVEPGLTYTGHAGEWGWGAQYQAAIRLEDENDEGYALGDKHSVSAWGAYQWNPGWSSSLRISAETEDSIDGSDSQIAGPVQTANPDNYGGERVALSFGTNWSPYLNEGHTFGAELTVPVYQDLNGPQLERDYGLTLGYQYRF